MRVSIQHNQKSSGWIFKQPYIEVATSVAFSEEELAIIRSKKLQKFVLLERGPDFIVCKRFENDQAYLNSLSGFEMSVAKLMKGTDTFNCETAVHAKNYEAQVTEALKTLKEFIVGNAQVAQSKSFEL